jgi:mono/diheme cytochrome c family protein
MMNPRTRKVLLPIVGIVAAANFFIGCGTARRDAPLLVDQDQAKMTDPQLALGERVFDEHCYQCHPGGDEGLAPAMNNKPLPQWLIKTQVRAGLGAMPSFGDDRISADELDALAAYVAHLRHEEVR